MVKYWDGYKHVYSPAKIKYNFVGPPKEEETSPQIDAETGKELPVKKVIHYSKQNGYANVWYDATNGVHPRVREMMTLQN